MTPAYQTLQDVIRQRRTDKVLGDPDHPVAYSSDQLVYGDNIVKQAIVDCGFAPFHYDRKSDGIAEPWRVYWMNNANCRQLSRKLPDLIPEMKPNNKMPSLLAGCGSLTMFTWLPQTPETAEDSAKLARVNREHLAATAAAVQNFLLLLTASGVRNYWASGTLIADYLFPKLGIPENQILTAAVFASYPEGQGTVEVVGGKQRQRRSDSQAWLKEVALSSD